MNATSALAVISVVLGCLLTASLGIIAFLIRSIYGLQTNVAVLTEKINALNEGATQGAQLLINRLASRIDLAEDAMDQFGDRLHTIERDLAVNTERLTRLPNQAR